MSFFQTRAWQMFEAKLLKSLEKIADQLERANDLKEKELALKEKETNK